MKLTGIIVAKSRKNGGFCVVIYDYIRGRFIRLVSPEKRKDHELLEDECTYKKDKPIEVKDIVEFSVYEKPPTDPIQPENYYFDVEDGFIKIGVATLNYLKSIAKKCNSEFIFDDINSRISEKGSFKYSFIMCEVRNLSFTIDKNSKCKGSFDYNGNHYNDFCVTINEDSDTDVEYYADKKYSKAVVCFSVGHVFPEYPKFPRFHYKYLCSILGYKER